MIPDDRATLIRLWSDPKHQLTPDEARTVEDHARHDPESMPMVLRFKAKVSLMNEGKRRMAECPMT